MMDIFLAAPTNMEMNATASITLPAVKRLVTGIGPVKTAITLMEYLHRFKERPGLILLFGLCGVFERHKERFSIGDILLAESECFGDLARCRQDSIEDIVLDNTPLFETFPAHPLQSLPGPFQKRLKGMDCKGARMTTVMCSSASFERAEAIREKTGAHAENMEGASFFLVAKHMSIPFLEIRAVSNIAGDERKNWRIDAALSALSNFFKEFLV